jgi:hypothetical protein
MNRRENEKMYGFYAPPSLMARFQAVAKAQDLNMSQLMRALARREISRYDKVIASEQ